MQFANAVGITEYNAICVCESWLNENIEYSELLLDNYNLYRSERSFKGETNLHGGVMLAVKSNIQS